MRTQDDKLRRVERLLALRNSTTDKQLLDAIEEVLEFKPLRVRRMTGADRGSIGEGTNEEESRGEGTRD